MVKGSVNDLSANGVVIVPTPNMGKKVLRKFSRNIFGKGEDARGVPNFGRKEGITGNNFASKRETPPSKRFYSVDETV